MTLYQYIIRRLLFLIPVLFGVLVLTFTISHLVPADPAAAYAGIGATPEQIETMRREFDLDKPLPVQFLRYLERLLHGDLGMSMRSRRPVLDDIIAYAPATIELSICALILTFAFGIPLGVLSAVHRDSVADHTSRSAALVGRATPNFWLGLMAQLLLFRTLGWLPFGGRIGGLSDPPAHITGLYILDSILTRDWPTLWSSIKHMILPASVLATSRIGYLARVQRATLLEVMSKPYLTVVRAKGMPERIVVWRHAFRNSLIPVVTVIGLQIGGMLGGSFVVELIFAWPGMGRYGTESIIALDFNAIMGVCLILSISYVLTNLVVDILYALLDPRIKHAM
jgi:peptide/nickel transport system permease protein